MSSENFNSKVLPVNFCLDIIILPVHLNIIRLSYTSVAHVTSAVLYLAAFTSLFELSSAHDANGLADYNGATSTRFQRATVFLPVSLKLKTRVSMKCLFYNCFSSNRYVLF